MNDVTLTVSQLNRYIKGIIEQDNLLFRVTVKGEISNFKAHYSGHMYFALKDEAAVIRCVMFRSAAQTLKFMPESGQKVIITGRIGVYERDGQYQLYADSMQPDGVGALFAAYEQLKAKLSAEGLFDEERKKPIPAFPSKIGVVTSPAGAAVRDIINIIKRRYRLADIYIYPVIVQGDGAPEDIANAVRYFDRSGWADVLIVGRGGGSIEDLWAFNTEIVARAAAQCRIPLISAVGHETDFTIIDFVSDLRAPTPSAAAELAVPDTAELLQKLSGFDLRLINAVRGAVKKKQIALDSVKNRAIYKRESVITDRRAMTLDSLSVRLSAAMNALVSKDSERLSAAASKLDALSPLATMNRGFSVIKKDEKIVKSVNSIDTGDEISAVFSDGGAVCEVKKIWKI
ncbi:MAG: exodeoxyribonuclease VII large subunit [Clostridia bacterium]|nr:exodeoxyribonuclease VII large subunit [Clostridia bacterium]